MTTREPQTEMKRVPDEDVLVEIENLKKYFVSESGYIDRFKFELDGGLPIEYDINYVKAVDDVSLKIKKGETLGLVGESGCGKSTLARTVLRLLEPTEGSVYFDGEDLADLSGENLRRRRKDIQMIFQDPQSSLDPRWKVGKIVEEPMEAHGMLDDEGRERRAKELLDQVGLDPQHYNRYPHEFSGGQRQRINIARALSTNPDFIVCDEPVSALDVSIQAQVLNTLKELQEELDLTFLFIAHDLSVIRYISDRIAVMYLGEIVEFGDEKEIFNNPQHPYTQSLLDSVPVPDPDQEGRKKILEGDVPSPINPPSGCRFRTRCPDVIPPEEFAFDDEEWAAIRRFTRAVTRREFDRSELAEMKERYFGGLSFRGDTDDVLEESLGYIEDEEWEQAEQLLTETFLEKSICAKEKPEYDVTPEFGSSRHYAACHLHRD